MMTFSLFLGFFIANLLGYGGGPSTIPLMEAQAVTHYHWLTASQFANVLAVANSLPGPVATKIATAIAYSKAGPIGALAALIGTVVPSALMLIVLMKFLQKFRKSAAVQGMTKFIQPVIAVLMAVLTFSILQDGARGIGWIQSLIIAAVALVLIRFLKIHPAFVIAGAFLYGGLILPHLGG
jgi:chromate transporter